MYSFPLQFSYMEKSFSGCKCKVYKKHVRVFIKLLTNYDADKLKNEAFP